MSHTSIYGSHIHLDCKPNDRTLDAAADLLDAIAANAEALKTNAEALKMNAEAIKSTALVLKGADNAYDIYVEGDKNCSQTCDAPRPWSGEGFYNYNVPQAEENEEPDSNILNI